MIILDYIHLIQKYETKRTIDKFKLFCMYIDHPQK